MSSPPELIKYDEDGDLILYVDDDTARYQVCSRTLARSSPVFKRMLRGGFAESRPVDGSDWIVELPDDKSEPMQIFLSIIHGRLMDVPKKLPIAGLHGLLVLTEKYNATEVLRLWAAGWIENAHINKGAEDHSIIGIAWELGQVELFRQLMENITETCTLDASGCVLFGGREQFLDGFQNVCYKGEHKLPLVLNYLEPTRMIGE
ncbi:hypothetical protein CkaCkLH20_03873 [Colletotrichum karsti]|uniref:BTB domain-containing protein n=1 Tax=Colletotrichum karsti TaxID=1095194 RepID=A0A9P6IAV2_9PEZI|nr:uncharacterized protein CkaCkLH20_03873 [Colletotrichum karsti]KAF9878381.1 hypothetical protein CkaCkLH20_03873 [Colletotrichum karsti]